MRFWASRDMSGVSVVWVGDAPILDVTRWRSDSGAGCLLCEDGPNATDKEKASLKAIFPVGIRKGQCVEIKLHRAEVVT